MTKIFAIDVDSFRVEDSDHPNMITIVFFVAAAKQYVNSVKFSGLLPGP